MHIEQSLFISYAHIDDQPLDQGQKGWITRFHGTLKAILSMRMGRDVKIWRDEKLTGNDVFSDEIVAQFKKSAVLLSVVTPRYLNSAWCTREAREFCQTAAQNGGLLVGNKSRMFKVIKTPVDREQTDGLPAHMKDLLGFEFFTYKDGAPLELDPDYGPEFSQAYKQKVAVLAQDISILLRALEAKGGEEANAGELKPSDSQAPYKPTVYLADCGYDRKPQRERLEGELKRLGYPVLPDKQMPMAEAEYVAEVDRMLKRCALSIHIIGENYAAAPDGPSGKSVGELQNERAVAHCGNGALKRLIWLPQGTTSEHPLQKAFIDSLQQDAQAQFGADLIAGDIEELRAAVHTTLTKLDQPKPQQQADDLVPTEFSDGAKKKLVYFICDERDRKASVPVRKLFKNLGFDVTLPAFEGDAAEVRKVNQQNLALCDVILLFYGAGDAAWKRAIDNDLRKMPSFRRDKRLPLVVTYLAGASTDDKQDLIDMEETNLIDGLQEFAETALTRLLRPVVEPEPET